MSSKKGSSWGRGSVKGPRFGRIWRLAVGTCAFVAGAMVLVGPVAVAADDESPLYSIDFAEQADGSVYDWLAAKGFELKKDAADKNKIVLSQTGEALNIQAIQPALGLILHEQDVPDAATLRVHWGVSEYPAGASYEKGIDNEAVMIHVFFGHESLSSGSMFVPDSPYFIGFFLCKDDPLEKPYTGRYFKKGGRYICVDHDQPGKATVTEIDLHAEFQSSFDLEKAPPVSGVSIEVDTTHSKNDGKAAAFVERIEFFK